MATATAAPQGRRRARGSGPVEYTLVKRVVAHGTHWDSEGEKFPGEEVTVPDVDVAYLEAQGTLVTAEVWAKMQELEAAKAQLAAAEAEMKPKAKQKAMTGWGKAVEEGTPAPETPPSTTPDSELPPELERYGGRKRKNE